MLPKSLTKKQTVVLEQAIFQPRFEKGFLCSVMPAVPQRFLAQSQLHLWDSSDELRSVIKRL